MWEQSNPRAVGLGWGAVEEEGRLRWGREKRAWTLGFCVGSDPGWWKQGGGVVCAQCRVAVCGLLQASFLVAGQ